MHEKSGEVKMERFRDKRNRSENSDSVLHCKILRLCYSLSFLVSEPMPARFEVLL